APLQSAGGRGLDRLDNSRMRALGGGQPAGDRLGLGVVLSAVALLECVDRRQYELRSEAARQPSQSARPPPQAQAPGMRADAVELLAPEFGMAFLDRGEPAVDVLQPRVGFRVGERAVERGAVDLALQIGAI